MNALRSVAVPVIQNVVEIQVFQILAVNEEIDDAGITGNPHDLHLHNIRVVGNYKNMLTYRRYKPLMITLICVDGMFALVLIILYRAELYDKFTLLMFIGALYSILFDVFTSIMLWS